MRTFKFKAQPTNSHFATVNQVFGAGLLSASDYCLALFRCVNCTQRFHYRALGSSWKLEGAVEQLNDGHSEKRHSEKRMLLKGAVTYHCFQNGKLFFDDKLYKAVLVQ